VRLFTRRLVNGNNHVEPGWNYVLGQGHFYRGVQTTAQAIATSGSFINFFGDYQAESADGAT
jgi:hypothetical protein